MADKKISALTGATTPLAGTEVLPIVQSGTTVKVSVANLTAGRSISALQAAINSSTAPVSKLDVWGTDAVAASQATHVGSIQLNENPTSLSQAGGLEWKAADFGAGYGWKAVTVDSSGVNLVIANRQNSATWTEFARFAQNGNFSVANGNLVIGTSGKGIDFSATPGTGTSELLSDYEEGTWTPTLNSFTVVSQTSISGTYTKIGRQVFLNIIVIATSIAAVAGSSTITNLPFAPGLANFSMVTLGNANTIAATDSGGMVNSTSSGTLYPPSTSGNSYMVISAVYTV